MPWIVKLDKEQDFIGKWALEHYRGASRARPRWSASRWRTATCPTEGAVVCRRTAAPMGQVTSARYSQQLGQVIGMAWVPAALAKDGARITISDEGKRLEARGPDEALLRPRRGGAALVSPRRFLSPGAGARREVSPMERGALAAGATLRAARRLERRRLVPGRASARCRRSASPTCSHIGKLEIQGDVAAITGRDLELGTRDPVRRRLVVPLLARRARSCSAAPATPWRSATASPRRPRTPTASEA